MKTSDPPKLEKFPAAKQRRLDQLLEKNSAGTLTIREQAKLNQLVAEAEALMVANARLLADFTLSEAGPTPTGAVPVTVWVHAQPAER